MTRRSGPTSGRQPASFISQGAWPHGQLEEGAPAAARYAQAIACRLREALDGATVADVARRAGLARSTIYDLQSGTTWPDVVSLAELEVALGVRLWPADPLV